MAHEGQMLRHFPTCCSYIAEERQFCQHVVKEKPYKSIFLWCKSLGGIFVYYIWNQTRHSLKQEMQVFYLWDKWFQKSVECSYTASQCLIKTTQAMDGWWYCYLVIQLSLSLGRDWMHILCMLIEELQINSRL